MATTVKVIPADVVRVTVDGSAYVARVSSSSVRITLSTSIELVDATRHIHTQNTPSTTWNVVHNLGRRPLVDVILANGHVVSSDVFHVDNNSLSIYHNSAALGSAVMT